MDSIQEVLTVKNATEWFHSDEKFTYCLDLLGLSLAQDGDDLCRNEVNNLEQELELIMIEERRMGKV